MIRFAVESRLYYNRREGYLAQLIKGTLRTSCCQTPKVVYLLELMPLCFTRALISHETGLERVAQTIFFNPACTKLVLAAFQATDVLAQIHQAFPCAEYPQP